MINISITNISFFNRRNKKNKWLPHSWHPGLVTSRTCTWDQKNDGVLLGACWEHQGCNLSMCCTGEGPTGEGLAGNFQSHLEIKITNWAPSVFTCVARRYKEYLCGYTWVFHRGRRCRPCWTMAAASRDLSNVFPLEGRNECGLLNWVGVSEAKLEHTCKIQQCSLWSASDVQWKLQIKSEVYGFTTLHHCYLALTVAAPSIDIPSGGQGEHMFTSHSNVFYEQPLQCWHHLGAGFILQHGVWKANETLWKINRRKQNSRNSCPSNNLQFQRLQ